MKSVHEVARQLATLLVLLATVSLPCRADEASEKALDKALDTAGDNRPQIVEALERVPAQQRAGMEFLIRHMPAPDLQSLTAEFLLENVEYAYRAWNESAWKDQIPTDVFFNDVLPYANINERRDRWRKDFFERFRPLVAEAKTPSEAAAILNQKVFPLVNVRYSTKRPKADQSPYESIDAELASCTGLSILLIDACRAVGVPARFVGIPLWTDRSGNHSWIEVYDQGWHFTGAAEPTGMELDKAWFVDRASQAKADEPRHAIYAVSYRHTPLRFPLIWDQRIDYVRAVNVTERYAGRSEPVPDGSSLVMFRVLNATNNDRCAANFRIRDAEGNVVYQGQTKDERYDANDHIAVPLPQNATFQVEVINGEQTTETALSTNAQEQLVTIRLADDDDVTATEEAADQQNADDEGQNADKLPADSANPSNSSSDSAKDRAAGSNTPAVTSAGAASSAQAVEQLQAYLGQAAAERGPVAEQPFAEVALTKADSDRAKALLWDDHRQRVRAERAAEMEQRELVLDGHHLRFAYKIFGEQPASGRSLFISMHGGGNAPPRVNDRQWENQKGLYEPEEGVYLSPRAPTDTWNLWHQAHIDPLFARLIANLVVLENVDPNRVYIMGYSAGGDGVYQLAPRMADSLAAAAMMAGHPNEASPLGLRNLPFTLHMGGDDAAYQRNEVARQWGEKLAELQANDPGGYEHWVKIHEGKGHWMEREDAAAVPWMAKFRRNPLPEKIVWWQDDVTHAQFYWLAVPENQMQAGTLVRAQRDGQQLRIDSSDVKKVNVRLSDRMLDLDQPVQIIANDQLVHEGTAARTIDTLAKTLAERKDPELMFSAELTVDLP